MRLRITRRILPPRIRNMNDVMKEMFLSDGMPEEIAENDDQGSSTGADSVDNLQ